MRLVIFGLTVSSSWGNGHATLWRGLCKALARAGHDVVFFERDVPYYAGHRDLTSSQDFHLFLYPDWGTVRSQAELAIRHADAAFVTSYCPDAIPASELVLNSRAIKVFYDLDTAVTLERIERGEPVPYVPPSGLSGFDVVFSFVGGRALQELREVLGARRVVPLYGSADPEQHKPVGRSNHYWSDLSYLGTYAADRQRTLEELFLSPAQRLPEKRFLIGGAQYPDTFPWSQNIYFVRHVPPREHSAFYCSSRATLNVTRGAMASVGYCPSGRLFEAAACETAIITDQWEGLDQFFDPGTELLIGRNADDVIKSISRSSSELHKVGRAARKRVLAAHTSSHRARELVNYLEAAA